MYSGIIFLKKRKKKYYHSSLSKKLVRKTNYLALINFIYIHSSTSKSNHPHICSSTHKCINSSICLSISLFVHPSIISSVYLSVHPIIYPYVSLPITSNPFISLSVHPSMVLLIASTALFLLKKFKFLIYFVDLKSRNSLLSRWFHNFLFSSYPKGS